MWALGGLGMTAPYAVKLGPAPFRRWLLDLLPLSKVQHLKGLADVMDNQARDILARKRVALASGDEALLHQVGEGKDIMSILCALSVIVSRLIMSSYAALAFSITVKANMEASEGDKLTEEELLGQMT